MINKNLRDNSIKEISKFLDKRLIKDIEESIYNFSVEYSENNGTPFLLEQIYETKSEELIKILQGKSLQFIIKSLNDNKINPKKFAFLRKSELIPSLEKKDTNKEKKGSNLFECKKCGKRNVTIKELQKKAADEPADQIVTCLECGNVWNL